MSETPDRARLEALVADLRKVSPFADQPQDDLEWFVAQAQERRIEVGGITVAEGAPADTMMVMLEGEMRARRENGPQDGPVFTARAGDVTGPAFLEDERFTVTGRAVLPIPSPGVSRRSFSQSFFSACPNSLSVVGLLTDRVRYVTREEQQREKLAALGKIVRWTRPRIE
jgi:hypothetical protein